MTRHFILRALAVALTTTAIIACDSSDNDNTTDNTTNNNTDSNNSTLSWQSCASDTSLQCTTLQVPMAHDDPDGEKITLSLNRIPASGSDPLGSLLFNPGGPGGSGLLLIEEIEAEQLIPDSIRERYHLIGFDPRGVGASTPIECDSLFDELDIELNEYPRTRAETETLLSALQSFSTACHQKHGTYLQHVGSGAVAKDMELIRQALAEPALNFMGYSYGTRLAALYAQNYPGTTGRMILDGSLPPTHSVPMLFGDELTVMEANLDRLTQACQQFSSCDPASYKQRLIDRVNTLINEDAGIELDLLATLLITAVQETAIIDSIAEPLHRYSQEWDVTPLLVVAELLEDEDDTDEDNDDSAAMLYAVSCADDAERPTIDDIEALRAPFNNISDLFAELQLANAAICAHWPAALDPLPTVSTSLAPQTLVIGGPFDAQTIDEWSRQMAEAIGGRYLQSQHEGHTVVFSEQNPCTDEVAINFLLTGQLPATEVCEAPMTTAAATGAP